MYLYLTKLLKIYYNIKYIESGKVDVLTNQLIHCIMHIAFGHFVRRKSRNNKAWNKSTDITINNILHYENGRNVDGIIPMVVPVVCRSKIYALSMHMSYMFFFILKAGIMSVPEEPRTSIIASITVAAPPST